MYQPIIRAETPEEAVQKYLNIPTDNPLIEFHGIDIAVIYEPDGVGVAVLTDNIGIIVDRAGEGKFKLTGWVYRIQHRNGLWMYPFALEQSIYSFWCFVEAATGLALRDWKYIDKRAAKQKRRKLDHISAEELNVGDDVAAKVNILIEFWGGSYVKSVKKGASREAD